MSLITGIEYAIDSQVQATTSFKPAQCKDLSRYMKLGRITWQQIEPLAWDPSVPDDLRYNWPWLDAIINPWIAAGYTDLGVIFGCKHSLYCAPTYTPPAGIGTANASAPPKSAQALTMYGRAVLALLRRYPSIKWIEVESEWQSGFWWLGGLTDTTSPQTYGYLTILRKVRQVVADAGLPVLVLLGGHTFNGLLDDNPDQATIDARLAALPEPKKTVLARALQIGMAALATGEYDAAEFHSLSGASGIGPAVAHTRAAMNNDKPIWVGDSFPGERVVFDPTDWNEPASQDAMTQNFLKLASNDSAAWTKFYADQVTVTRAKLAAATAAGCARIYLGPLFDWPILFTSFPYEGILNKDGSRRPVCATIQAAALGSWLGSTSWSGGL